MINITKLFKLTTLVFFLFQSYNSYSQRTIEFRISSINSNVDDMDGFGSGDSDPQWDATLSDGSLTQNFSLELSGVNCPGTRSVNNTFFTNSYNCNFPNNFTFTWRAFEDDGASTGDAATPTYTITIPSSSLNQTAFTNVGSYTGTATGSRCGGGGTVTWGITLQYRVNGTFLTPTSPSIVTPVIYNQGDSAAPLTATGSNLLWYTVASGGTSSSTAPTPSTTAVGTTSYWVTQTQNGCESLSSKIDVTVNGVLSNSQFTDRYNFKFYPNPVKNNLIIEFDNLTNPRLNVFDTNGRLLLNDTLHYNQNSIDMSNLPVGIYIFNLYSNEGNTIFKVVKN